MCKVHDFFIYLKGVDRDIIYVSAAEIEFLGKNVFFRLPDKFGYNVTSSFVPVSIIEKIEDDTIHQFIDLKKGEVFRV